MAVLSMILSGFFIALLGLLAKFDQSAMPLSLAVFLRLAIPAILIIPFLRLQEIKQCLFHASKIQWLRAGFAFAAQYCLFAYIEEGSLLNAILLYNIAPLIIPFLAALFYQERLSRTVLISALLGFIGIFLVLSPNKAGLNPVAFLGLASGFFMACSQVCFHRSSRSESLNHNIFSVYALSSCFALVVLSLTHPNAIRLTVHFNVLTIIILIAMSCASLGNQAFRYFAYKHAKHPSHLAPFMYCAVVFSGLFDWIFFNSTPGINTYMGTLLILIAALLVAFRKNDVKSTPKEEILDEKQICFNRH